MDEVFLDTSFCVDLLREQARDVAGAASAALSSLGEEAVCVSVFVACELEAGACLSHNAQKERERVEGFLKLVEVVYPDRRFAAAYGAAESRLRSAGTPVPTMDLLIGVTSLVAGEGILTRDPTHFARIPGLSVVSYASG